MKAGEIATRAAGLVSGDRAEQHGDMHTNHECIATMWQAYLDAKTIANGGVPQMLDGEDVANLMECLKIARRLTGESNIDDYIDGAGYAAIAGQLRTASRSSAA